jgi:hypothetical protein
MTIRHSSRAGAFLSETGSHSYSLEYTESLSSPPRDPYTITREFAEDLFTISIQSRVTSACEYTCTYQGVLTDSSYVTTDGASIRVEGVCLFDDVVGKESIFQSVLLFEALIPSLLMLYSLLFCKVRCPTLSSESDGNPAMDELNTEVSEDEAIELDKV